MAEFTPRKKKLYIDSSAITKRYTMEEGSDFVNQLYEFALDKDIILYTSRHSVIEVGSAVMRLYREGRMTQEDAFGHYHAFLRESLLCLEFMEIAPKLEQKSVELMSKHHLKAADALHVACGIELRGVYDEGVLFVSSDRRQYIAALEEGMKISDPVSG